MQPQRPQPPIRPKVSTMPRAKTEAAAYLDIYKLVTEKKRLEHELAGLDQRRDRIQQRLEALNTQIGQLETTAHDLRDDGQEPRLADAKTRQGRKGRSPNSAPDPDFNTVFLEY
jgi:predicted  nucleic acid-binding Zn-ribbon protein